MRKSKCYSTLINIYTGSLPTHVLPFDAVSFEKSFLPWVRVRQKRNLIRRKLAWNRLRIPNNRTIWPRNDVKHTYKAYIISLRIGNERKEPWSKFMYWSPYPQYTIIIIYNIQYNIQYIKSIRNNRSQRALHDLIEERTFYFNVSCVFLFIFIYIHCKW